MKCFISSNDIGCRFNSRTERHTKPRREREREGQIIGTEVTVKTVTFVTLMKYFVSPNKGHGSRQVGGAWHHGKPRPGQKVNDGMKQKNTIYGHVLSVYQLGEISVFVDEVYSSVDHFC